MRHVHAENGEEDMPDFRRTTMASRAYDKAHAAHYATKDLHQALELYKGVLAAHPNTQEAEYSRTQMRNIARSVVPSEDLLAAEVELTLACLEPVGPPETGAAALTPLASELAS
jgi:hypothetical protein